MFPYCFDAPAGAVLELFMMMATVVVWFTSLLSCSRC